MTTRNFPTTPLDELRHQRLGESVDFDNISYTLREAPSTISLTRWGIIDRMVFEAEEGEFYEAVYEYGATENQDFDDLDDNAEHTCVQVAPREVTITEYVKVTP